MHVLALELELPLRQLLGDPCTQEWRLEERELLFAMASLPMGDSSIVLLACASTDVTAMVTWVDVILFRSSGSRVFLDQLLSDLFWLNFICFNFKLNSRLYPTK